MKKTILFTIAILVSLISFAATGEEEASYENPFISYNVEKVSGKVLINLQLKNIDQYAEIRVVRSDNPITNFRRVKLLNKEAISEFSKTNTIVDKYPLPSQTDSYYKIITVDTYGVQKSYPSVLVK